MHTGGPALVIDYGDSDSGLGEWGTALTDRLRKHKTRFPYLGDLRFDFKCIAGESWFEVLNLKGVYDGRIIPSFEL